MRKVYQACLAVIAVLSLGALVIYRHEYNKLRYVLEVLNYFGSPGGANCNETWTMLNEEHLHAHLKSEHFNSNENFDDPRPSWQRLTNEIYVYSAYQTDVGQVRAVGIGKIERPDSIILSCDIVYFGERDQIHYLHGELSHESIDPRSEKKIPTWRDREKDTYEALNFICKYPEGKNIPNGIVTGIRFSTKSNTRKGEAPFDEMAVILPVRELNDRTDGTNRENSSKTNKEMTAGVCITSFGSNAITFKEIIDFITFHKSFGFDQFIVYDSGSIAPQFEKLIQRQLRKMYAVPLTSTLPIYTMLQWNFPFSHVPPEIVRRVIHTDCLYRTHGKIDIVATLTWDEYIVLKYHSTIAKLFFDFDQTDLKADGYKISTINFCLDRTTEPPKIFTYKKLVDSDPIFIYRQSKDSRHQISPESDVTTHEPSPDLITVHRYEESCHRSGSRKKDLRAVPLDGSYVGKFAQLLKNSTARKS